LCITGARRRQHRDHQYPNPFDPTLSNDPHPEVD
jgi:hypothetical protein